MDGWPWPNTSTSSVTTPTRSNRGSGQQIPRPSSAKGLAERNNAELTLVKKEAEKKRQRHTLDGLKTIIDAATTPPGQRAVCSALASLQRREDIVTWLKSAADMDKNTLTVSPGRPRATTIRFT